MEGKGEEWRERKSLKKPMEEEKGRGEKWMIERIGRRGKERRGLKKNLEGTEEGSERK